MNSHSIQITGLAEIPEPLEIGKDYTLLIKASCNNINKSDQQDGGFSYKYRLKQISGEIQSEYGTTVVFKDKGSQSAKLRAQIMIQAEEEGAAQPNTIYEIYMTRLRHYWPLIKQYLDKLD